MADLQAKDLKLIQYLNEAYGKEKQLETALQAHISMTTRPPYKKRLQQHLKETKGHAREVERRIKKLGGTAETVDVPGPDAVSGAAQAVQNVANRAAALAQGPMHALRGTGEQERLLKNARTEFQDEAEEIATYTMIETLAEAVGDKETAQVARKIRREEERMRDFLAKLIPTLTKAVAQEEIPAAERRTSSRRSSSRRSSSSRSSGGSSSSSSRSSGSSSRSRSGSSSGGTSRSRSGSSASKSSGSRSSGSSRSSSARKSSGSSRSSSSASKSSGSRSSGSSRAKSSGSGSSRAKSSGSSRAKSSGSRSGGSRSGGSK
ncbi:MAG TPA: DUF892 family protein [Thermoleophilaceae bacterium]